MADANQLQQVFYNLLSNALKFHGGEPPLVHVSAASHASQVAEEGGVVPAEWVFSVRDNGIGIEAQYAQHIFEIFRRLHRPAEYPGTGIGLALCKKIVERHGGRIWVESQPGEGATFYFSLPATSSET
jgi:signal transduction histidine kinase